MSKEEMKQPEETKEAEAGSVSEETVVAKESEVAAETKVSEEIKVSDDKEKTEANKPSDAGDSSSDKESAKNDASDGKVFVRSKKKDEKKGAAYEIFDWLRTICIGVLAGIFIVVFLVQRDDVYGTSMNPTLSSGDVVFTQKLSTYFKNFKRGDIVVLDGSNMEGYTKTEYLIKRIVGLPGETIRIADGNVYIKPADAAEFYLLQENYLPAGTKTMMMDEGTKKGYDEITLGEDEYFCMGDNRPVSNDSRNLGPFEVKRIKGVAIIRVFPFNEIKVL